MNLKTRIAVWLCPELLAKSHQLHALKAEILEHRNWLSEFPEVHASMQRLLDIDRAVYGDGKPQVYSMWDFREGLRRKARQPEMTERQKSAWPEYIKRILQYRKVPEHSYVWDIAWRDEIRPGRGHDLSATYCDGEVMAQITMDVYGNGHESIADVEWVHSSADEECECAYCHNERGEDSPHKRPTS